MLESATDYLLDKLAKVRRLALDNIHRPLTVEEAQLLNTCRICRGGTEAVFVMNCGKEFAHQKCLNGGGLDDAAS